MVYRWAVSASGHVGWRASLVFGEGEFEPLRSGMLLLFCAICLMWLLGHGGGLFLGGRRAPPSPPAACRCCRMVANFANNVSAVLDGASADGAAEVGCLNAVDSGFVSASVAGGPSAFETSAEMLGGASE